MAVPKPQLILHSESKPQFLLDNSLVHKLFLVSQFANDVFEQTIGKDTTPRQYAIMVAIQASDDPVCQMDISKKTGIDRSTTSEIIRRLEKRGLIRRKKLQQDLRSNYIELTASGRKLVNSIHPMAQKVEDELNNMIPRQDRGMFMTTMDAVLSHQKEMQQQK